jgi:DNA-binding transcriptional LysR family regulator
MIQLHPLRALVAIADTGSFTSAAQRLGVSQSSLSHAIADLEKELGILLFERGRQGAHVTEAGKSVLAHAREVLARLEMIQSEADNKTKVSGRIRIGSIPSATLSLLPKAIANFGRLYPKVDVVLLEEPCQGTEQLTEWLNTRTVDLAFLELPVAHLETVPVLQDELCAVIPAGSAWSRRKRVSVRELARKPFVMSRHSSDRLLRAAYGEAGLELAIRFQVQDLGTMLSMVREGLGISMIPRLALPTGPAGVAVISVSPRVRREVGFAVKSLKCASPAVLAFIRKTQELVR